MRIPDLHFRQLMAGKTLWAISAMSDDDPALAEPLLSTLRITAKYLGMNWGGYILGYANRPGDIHQDAAVLSAAQSLFV